MSTNGFGSNAPAFVTRMSTSGTCSTRPATPSAVPMSAATGCRSASGRSCASCFTASVARSSLRALTTTGAPAPASPAAMAYPIPAVEPVTRARRPVRSMCTSSAPVLHRVARTGVVDELGDEILVRELGQCGAHRIGVDAGLGRDLLDPNVSSTRFDGRDSGEHLIHDLLIHTPAPPRLGAAHT